MDQLSNRHPQGPRRCTAHAAAALAAKAASVLLDGDQTLRAKDRSLATVRAERFRLRRAQEAWVEPLIDWIADHPQTELNELAYRDWARFYRARQALERERDDCRAALQRVEAAVDRLTEAVEEADAMPLAGSFTSHTVNLIGVGGNASRYHA